MIINIEVIGAQLIKLPSGDIVNCEPIKPMFREPYHVYWSKGKLGVHANSIISTAVVEFYTPSEYPEMYI